MKMKSLMTLMLTAMVSTSLLCACGSDDDETEVPAATEVVGSYEGEELVEVMGEVTNETETYVFTKATDQAVDFTIPTTGEGGMMVIPALAVKNIPLTRNGNTITGSLAQYSGKVTDARGAEKEYTISGLTVIFSGQNVAATFSLKYGSMPFAMATTFTGVKR